MSFHLGGGPSLEGGNKTCTQRIAKEVHAPQGYGNPDEFLNCVSGSELTCDPSRSAFPPSGSLFLEFHITHLSWFYYYLCSPSGPLFPSVSQRQATL